jgi:hypothetical protein
MHSLVLPPYSTFTGSTFHHVIGALVFKKAMPPPSSPSTLVPLDAVTMSETKDSSQPALEHSGYGSLHAKAVLFPIFIFYN